MKFLKPFILVTLVSLFLSCDKVDDPSIPEVKTDPSTIEIGEYTFNFKTTFVLEELQGIDSYVGRVNGDAISLSFDYGWYTSPAENLSSTDYVVTEDDIKGYYRQIVRPLNAKDNRTSIHLYKKSDKIASPWAYNSLTMSVTNLTAAEQDVIIDVFDDVEVQ